MPLGRNVSKNISELYADNKKSGKAKGYMGKMRTRPQIQSRGVQNKDTTWIRSKTFSMLKMLKSKIPVQG